MEARSLLMVLELGAAGAPKNLMLSWCSSSSYHKKMDRKNELRRRVQALRKTSNYLSTQELMELRDMIESVLDDREEKIRAEEAEERARTVIRSRLSHEKTRCGKDGCRCQRGELHGPYWVAYDTYGDGRVKKRYIGKDHPDGKKAKRPKAA